MDLKYGNFYKELPEQEMDVKYLTGKEKVLEIGGNIGRNSLVIASILENSNNLVTVESDSEIAKQLTENRDLNNKKFYIENSALSNRKLIQKDWQTIPSNTLKKGFKWVNTITYKQLQQKYKIAFDTLVLDCEGAFYYILKDMPEVLDNINLIIMENDYHISKHKKFIDKRLKKNNFFVDYSEGLTKINSEWKDSPCYNNFYEVWKKKMSEK